AGAAALVKDSGDRAAMIGAHRDAVAIAPHHDQRLLDCLAVLVHDVVEHALHSVALFRYALAYRAKLGRRILAKLALASEELVQLSDQLVELRDASRDPREPREAL